MPIDQARIQRFHEDYRRTREQIQRAIVGHDAIIDGVLTCLFAGGHALLEGVPGLGKTLLIRSLSEAAPSGLLAHPVHPRSDARRRDGNHDRGGERGRP